MDPAPVKAQTRIVGRPITADQIFAFLRDRQWHSMMEAILKLGANLPAEMAVRVLLQIQKRSRSRRTKPERHRTKNGSEKPDFNELVLLGRRHYVGVRLRDYLAHRERIVGANSFRLESRTVLGDKEFRLLGWFCPNCGTHCDVPAPTLCESCREAGIKLTLTYQGGP